MSKHHEYDYEERMKLARKEVLKLNDGAWSAGKHRFNDKMVCSNKHCGITFSQHQRRGEQCVGIQVGKRGVAKRASSVTSQSLNPAVVALGSFVMRQQQLGVLAVSCGSMVKG